jgi:hypothetical protein
MRLVERTTEGRRGAFVRTAHPAWGAITSLVGTYAPALVLRDALQDVPGLEAAFVFGSAARGDDRTDSDLDLLLFGDDISEPDLGAALLDASLVLDRSVDAKRYDRARFLRAAVPGGGFLPAALAGPKHWIIGSPDVLPPVRAKAA